MAVCSRHTGCSPAAIVLRGSDGINAINDFRITKTIKNIEYITRLENKFTRKLKCVSSSTLPCNQVLHRYRNVYHDTVHAQFIRYECCAVHYSEIQLTCTVSNTVPVEHIPVGLDEDSHKEGVVGAGCDVGATRGRISWVEVIRHTCHCCITEPASKERRGVAEGNQKYKVMLQKGH